MKPHSFPCSTSAFALILSVLIFSCTPDPVVPVDKSAQSTPDQDTPPTASMMVLGKKLKNPYSVENMREAYEKLKQSNHEKVKEVLQDIEIKTSHLYVKFLPGSEQEVDILTRDPTLNLYDFPLDYKIEKMGYYRDPAVPAGTLTPKYCAVPVGYTFPQRVRYEILAELFIPQEVALTDESISKDMADALAYEAEKINGADNTLQQKREAPDPGMAVADWFCDFFGCNPPWTPGGRIRVYQNSAFSYIDYKSVLVGYDYSRCDAGRTDGGNNGPLYVSSDACRRPIYRTFKVQRTATDDYAPVKGAKDKSMAVVYHRHRLHR